MIIIVRYAYFDRVVVCHRVQSNFVATFHLVYIARPLVYLVGVMGVCEVDSSQPRHQQLSFASYPSFNSIVVARVLYPYHNLGLQNMKACLSSS